VRRHFPDEKCLPVMHFEEWPPPGHTGSHRRLRTANRLPWYWQDHGRARCLGNCSSRGCGASQLEQWRMHRGPSCGPSRLIP
jgi:hypothetical protein